MAERSIDREKIIAELSHEILDTSQVSDILGNSKDFPMTLIENLSIETALKYWNEQLSYEAADYVMNNLYSFWVNNEYFLQTYPFTDVAWECFQAFDAGEYYRANEDKGVSPDIKYTRPLIEDFLRKRMLIV
ncbi:hypothetical protein F0P96_15295 [Hymenobacter busanensis]|uniref:Uncharacterized protein n=1 Tax=Hymenobacter busanensis TaxID=2607656 RepID=A0A7L4ZZ09_9BACT|nr:hypothetical protein [Hymenobacter busanensis]KAA9331597.1 hypothetical protein F0P96_15295 [Hymenobacter busanensis]QHJ08749.1 hypothetical protein GUY19_16230 [Hymenobacter busanensis]